MKVRIGELAKMTGCQVVTIRYYEKEGLLKTPERTEGNYRLYGDEDIARLRFIRHCRQHDMSLSEIRELLAFKDHPSMQCEWITSLVEKHIASVEARIQSLLALKEHLSDLACRCSGGKGADCGILKSLDKGEHCAYCNKSNVKERQEKESSVL